MKRLVIVVDWTDVFLAAAMLFTVAVWTGLAMFHVI